MEVQQRIEAECSSLFCMPEGVCSAAGMPQDTQVVKASETCLAEHGRNSNECQAPSAATHSGLQEPVAPTLGGVLACALVLAILSIVG